LSVTLWLGSGLLTALWLAALLTALWLGSGLLTALWLAALLWLSTSLIWLIT
jgi:hypothetical protein